MPNPHPLLTNIPYTPPEALHCRQNGIKLYVTVSFHDNLAKLVGYQVSK